MSKCKFEEFSRVLGYSTVGFERDILLFFPKNCGVGGEEFIVRRYGKDHFWKLPEKTIFEVSKLKHLGSQ